MKRLTLITLGLLLLVSCVNSSKQDHTTSKIISETTDGRVDLYTNLNEIVLFSNNTFLFYKHISIDSLMMVWGNAKYDKVQYDTLPMFAIGPPLLEWNNDDVICLRQGCGTSCFFVYIMSFETGEIKRIMYPMAYDSEKNQIAYTDSDNPQVFVSVEDLLTGKRMDIIEPFKPGPFPGLSIDSISLHRNKLFIRWVDDKDNIKEKLFDVAL